MHFVILLLCLLLFILLLDLLIHLRINLDLYVVLLLLGSRLAHIDFNVGESMLFVVEVLGQDFRVLDSHPVQLIFDYLHQVVWLLLVVLVHAEVHEHDVFVLVGVEALSRPLLRNYGGNN